MFRLVILVLGKNMPTETHSINSYKSFVYQYFTVQKKNVSFSRRHTLISFSLSILNRKVISILLFYSLLFTFSLSHLTIIFMTS